ncbi:hypothetical protein SAMN05444008_110184 [Cnuella takakiae]|uniref:Transposase IS200 like n=1 Tax=Cnuella takakiae TaxID=1302690 RepID=A0A1M5DDH0_9BACT|nr:hypothetical protein [Cnuella takakiae]OLY94008.1 hypothetical protein BUE76_20555 [Cnuella takakiae]SHF64966.1 hypothetical protein SAMN05444008_110184 [Cnuella takakiae]
MTAFKDPLLPGALYHIFNRAVGREQLFVQPGNYDFFFSKLQHHIAPCAQILAYSFLPNHFHLMVRLNSEPELLLQLQQHKRTLSTANLPT